MFLKNTSAYDTLEVRRLLTYAENGFDLRGVAVHLKNSRHAYAGRAYASIPRLARSNVPVSATRLVVLRVGRPERFPVDNMRTTTRWVDLKDQVTAQRELDRLAYGTAEYSAWHREHRVWTVHRRGDQINRIQKMVRKKEPYGGAKSPLVVFNDWREAIVGLAAHEFNHIYQFQNKMPCSESECERAAARRLELYRGVKP